MNVKLKVLLGKNAGQELPINGPRFLIGRDEGCQLRARSDSIAPQHCVIEQHDGLVTIRDLSGSGATIVNQQSVSGTRELKTGDHLRVGALEFEVVMTTGLATKKKPKVNDAGEAAERLAASGPAKKKELDVDALWGADDAPAEAPKSARMTPEEMIALGLTPSGGEPTGPLKKDDKKASVETGRAAADMLNKMRKNQP